MSKSSVFVAFFHPTLLSVSLCINESLSKELHTKQIILTGFVLCGSQNFCLSCIISVCLFPFFPSVSGCWPAVPLPRQPFGRAAQVQERVGQRHEMHRSVRWHQPCKCCILSRQVPKYTASHSCSTLILALFKEKKR